jgi:hypothetical protein
MITTRSSTSTSTSRRSSRSSGGRRRPRTAAVLLAAMAGSAVLAGCAGQSSTGQQATGRPAPPATADITAAASTATGSAALTAGASPSTAVAAPSPAVPALGTVAPYPTTLPKATSPVRALPGPAVTAGINAVAAGGVIALGSADTTIDTDPNATARRAVTWLDPAFAAQVRAFPPIQAPGAQWAQWASHRAALRVSTRLGGDEHPPDTATTAYRQVLATVAPVGRDGWTGPLLHQVWFVTLTRVHGRWLLASSRGG